MRERYDFTCPDCSLTGLVSGGEDVAVEAAAQRVLDARAAFPTSTLADLYDPLAMPPALAAEHTALDRVADCCYHSVDVRFHPARLELRIGLCVNTTSHSPPFPAAGPA